MQFNAWFRFKKCNFRLFALIIILLFSSCTVCHLGKILLMVLIFWFERFVLTVFLCISAELRFSDVVDLTLLCRYGSPRGVLLQVTLQQQFIQHTVSHCLSRWTESLKSQGLVLGYPSFPHLETKVWRAWRSQGTEIQTETIPHNRIWEKYILLSVLEALLQNLVSCLTAYCLQRPS